MNNNWEKLTLADIADITMGQSPSSLYYNSIGDGMPFLQGNRTFGNIYPIFDTWTTNITKKAQAQDIIMSVRAPVGEINITPVDICIGRGLCSIRMKNNNQKFLYYLMKYLQDSIVNKENGTVFGSINRNDINKLSVYVPTDIKTQRKIAKILSDIDDKIELNNKINENLEQQAQAIFKNWFIDTNNHNRKICKAEEYFDITIGKTPPRKEPEWFSLNNTDIKWVSISDMGNCGLYISNSSEYLVPEAITKHNIKIIPRNTVILSFKLTVGRVAITDCEMSTNEAIAHFKTDNDNIIEYLYCYLKNFNYQTMGSTSSIATAVNSKIIKAMSFIIPTEEEIEKFHTIVKQMFNNIRVNQKENQYLIQLRDTLLPKLMSGELDVENIDIKI